MDMASKREEGEKKSKHKKKVEKEREVMFHRAEDNETQSGQNRRQREEVRQEDQEVGAGNQGDASGRQREEVKQHLYPSLDKVGEEKPLQQQPPPYNSPTRTRATSGPLGDWSKSWKSYTNPFSPQHQSPSAPPSSPGGAGENYPMIHVANPNTDVGAPATVLVYRTWTMGDIKKALEGVPSPKEDVQEFVVAMEAIKASYNLNGLECQQILMTAMGLDWHKVVGDWSPTEAGEILAHNDPALGPRYTAVLGRVTGRFQRRADYTEIGRVKQRDDEPFGDFRVRMEKVFWMHSGIVYDADQNGAYQQQLKNALYNGSLDRIQGWICKHVVGLGTKTMNEFVDFALHADKVTKNKNPGGKGCWSCGKMGHLARDCPLQNQDTA